MARPSLDGEVLQYSIKIRCRRGQDDDLIEFFEGVPAKKRALAVKIRIRTGAPLRKAGSSSFNDTELTAAAAEFIYVFWSKKR